MIRRVIVSAVLIGGAACSKPAPTATTSAADKPAQIPVVDVTLADYAIKAPQTLPAGYTTFRTSNSGKEIHQAALVRLDSGKTATDFQQAMQQEMKGPPPGWITWLGGPQNTAEVTIQLQPGNYVWYCIIPGSDGMPHMMKGMMSPMTVTPASGATAAAPTQDIDVSMHDYDWEISKPITAGKHTLKITTAVGQPHEMVILQLAPGKTPQDMLAWAEKPEGPPPAVSGSGVAVLQANGVNYETVEFTPGKYVLMCFVPAADGKPHAAHGMVKEFTVQ